MSQIAQSIREIGEIQINDFDFMELLNRDVVEIEADIARSLRRLGNMKVMELDFHTSIPAVDRVANKDVDLVGFIRRTANYKVMEWDFRNALHVSSPMNMATIRTLAANLEEFLRYLIENLVDEPGHSHIKVEQIAPRVLRFKIIMTRRDVAMLIGMQGHTAGAIRRILKGVAAAHGAHALLVIVTHEEEATGASRA
jgi:predicted RNA-binding protein YlqC (UPF0109 family)